MDLSNKSRSLIKALQAVKYLSEEDAARLYENPEGEIFETELPRHLDLTKLDAAALFYDGEWIILDLN